MYSIDIFYWTKIWSGLTGLSRTWIGKQILYRYEMLTLHKTLNHAYVLSPINYRSCLIVEASCRWRDGVCWLSMTSNRIVFRCHRKSWSYENVFIHVSNFRCWSALNTWHFSLIRLWISSQWWYKYSNTDESAWLKNKKKFLSF